MVDGVRNGPESAPRRPAVKLRLSEQAVRDRQRLAAFLADRNPRAALRAFRAITQSVSLLPRTPFMGTEKGRSPRASSASATAARRPIPRRCGRRRGRPHLPRPRRALRLQWLSSSQDWLRFSRAWVTPPRTHSRIRE
ncbi:MAG: type II toxin-antitoxin system RelE/ParE family toxin [Brevundimonas sp.]|uniref:type II toxin-antitoxin system RelE/ParE family toxin n=1 Tax=Brevundimonas sp. TaxID=1871086 RepID=UPI002561B546|nr:type II toxin-antitoxin system RelE/ParE family toxin [Brevundimonas sp.]